MERFRLRVKQQASKGQIWELHMFPAVSGRAAKESDAKIMGSSASPETIQWLRELSEPFLEQAEEPGPIKASEFRPGTPPRWLQHADGMRLALGFASARYLTKPAQRKMFRDGLLDLPAEVVLYWFTLCFYGYRQLAGRAALRTLLTYEQPAEKVKPEPKPTPGKAKKRKTETPTLFGTNAADDAGEKPKKRSRINARK
jgi:hypothetical protein